MASPEKRAQCVAWFIETKSDIQTQRNYLTMYGEISPSRSSIHERYHKFMTMENVNHKKGYGSPSTRVECVERVHETFSRSPTKSIPRASQELNMARATIHRLLHKRLRLSSYKVPMLHALKPNDYSKRFQFAVVIRNRVEKDHYFLNRIIFTDKSTFHVSRMVNKHNVRILGSEKPNVVQEVERSRENVNLWCGLLHDRVISPFFFLEITVTADIY
ncbi:hypothetical protein AVEN_204755-1 [Araneus ventricosus]|uniref:Uncharacterized protein n=1 Tax=Araneus ventricosus TaxID=182803 RepID=A0A4Y2FYW5_ARAVE|nr:hypothetical protein AVEN_204755-1 [Araneus ventricosus]